VRPCGNGVQQRVEQRREFVRSASADKGAGGAGRGGAKRASWCGAGRASSADDGAPARTASVERPPWRPSASPAAAAEEREKESERIIRTLSPVSGSPTAKYLRHDAPAREPLAKRLGGVAAPAAPSKEPAAGAGTSSHEMRQEKPAAAQLDARDASGDARHEVWLASRAPESAHSDPSDVLESATDGDMTQWMDGFEVKVSLRRMLDAILHAYGVDLSGQGSGQGGREEALRRFGSRLQLAQVAMALSDGVLMCKLATSVERVTCTKTRCLPQSPTSSSIRGWTLDPKNRSQRVNNIRIALAALRSDRGIQVKGHASHSCLYHPEPFERGDMDAVHSLVCIVYDSLPGNLDVLALKSRQGGSRNEASASSAGRARDTAEARPRGDARARHGEATDARSQSIPRDGGEEAAPRVARPRAPRSLSPPRPAAAEALQRADDAAAACDNEDAVMYDAPSEHGLAPRVQGPCAQGCGGWQQVEALVSGQKAVPEYSGAWLEVLPGKVSPGSGGADRDLKGEATASLQLQLHTCRWLVSLNLPEAPPALSRHEFANLSQAADASSFLEDPLKNGCMLLHVAQVLRGQPPATPPWCKAQGRPTSVAAVRKNVEAALQLVQPILLHGADACEPVDAAFDVEALVSGDDVAVWTLLHRLRLASRRRSSMSDPASVVGSVHGEGRAGKEDSRHSGKQALSYSCEQVELLEVALVMWLSAVAQHVPALR